MFVTSDVWMVFKAAKLTVAEVDKVERRMAECQFVLEPFPYELAQELGDSVASHLFTPEGALRTELASVTLDPRVPMQRMFARGTEGVPATQIDDVEVLAMTCSRQVDDKTRREWIKATVRVRFDFSPARHREWIAMYFGYGFHATFEAGQGDLFDDGADGEVVALHGPVTGGEDER